MVRTRLRLSLFGGSKNPHGGKEAWYEPDFDLAYFSGSKNPHGGKKKVWYPTKHNTAENTTGLSEYAYKRGGEEWTVSSMAKAD